MGKHRFPGNRKLRQWIKIQFSFLYQRHNECSTSCNLTLNAWSIAPASVRNAFVGYTNIIMALGENTQMLCNLGCGASLNKLLGQPAKLTFGLLMPLLPIKSGLWACTMEASEVLCFCFATKGQCVPSHLHIFVWTLLFELSFGFLKRNQLPVAQKTMEWDACMW